MALVTVDRKGWGFNTGFNIVEGEQPTILLREGGES
jgi:hypothetical protein